MSQAGDLFIHWPDGVNSRQRRMDFMDQNRDHFRIVFPIEQRPSLTTELAAWNVIDLSENGAKVEVQLETYPCAAGEFEATIKFRDGTAAPVKASVLRRSPEEMVLQFDKQIPYPLIMGEQRRLLKLFPRERLS